MNDALKMQISAYVDGELPEAEAELLTRRLSQDPELKRQLAAYLDIGRLMRGEAALPGIAGMRDRVAAALEQEQAPAAAQGSWLKPVAGVAIAATVAAVALVGLRQADVAGPGAGAPVPTAAIAVDDGSAYTEPAASEVLSDRPSDRLMQYYLSHGQTSGELGANGILSRLVTLELRGGDLVEIEPGAGDELESGEPEGDNVATEGVQEQ